jgi:glycosyltransferase involved in cell wall biosynthesis
LDAANRLERVKERVRPYYLRWLYFPLHPDRKPSYFDRPWQFPASTDITAHRQPSFLFLPMTDWHTRLQRTQHLARSIAQRGHACFYLNPHVGREFPNPYPFSSSPQLRYLDPLVAEVHVQLPAEPVFHHRLLRRSEVSRLADALEPLLGSSPAPQLVSLPTWWPVAEELRRRGNHPVIYDCHDVLSGFPNMAREIVDAEAAAIEGSDLVLFSSRGLVGQWSDRAKRWMLLRNAVDDSWLQRELRAPGERTKYADYIGALDSWFDMEAIAHAAGHLADWTFRLIGRVEHEPIRTRLASFRNVEFLGEVTHERLHDYLKDTRVALIPFLRNELTLATNPIKLYEYFSYGLPVVASRLPEIEEYGSLVHFYDGASTLARAVESAANDARGPERRAIAARETWGQRVDVLLGVASRLA